jgi:hypothetical protein
MSLLETLLIPTALTLSSAAAYVFGRRQAKISLRLAIFKFFEVVGTMGVFLLLNTAAVVLFAAAARQFGIGGFVSLYVTGDPALIIFSAVQGLVFRLWRDLDRGRLR